MKKLAFIIAALLLVCLCACSSQGAAPSALAESPAVSESAKPVESTAPAESAMPSAEVSPEVSSKPSPSEAPVSASPSPSSSEAPSPSAETAPSEAPSPSAEALPYSVQTSDTALSITGSGVERDYYFTMAELQSIGGYVNETYFSRGKEPPEDSNSFEGINLSYLLDNIVSLTDSAKKVSFIAADGYSSALSLSQIRASYIDETDLSKSLPVILAWSQDGSYFGGTFRLVMGQAVEGEYNRQNWTRDVVSLEVKAG